MPKLNWRLLTKKRGSSTQSLPPGKEDLAWVTNTVTLIYGERDAILVDTFLSKQKAHFQCFDLPHSDDCFVIAFPVENTEAFLEGHNQAFAYFEGVPRTILYDNTRIAVKEIAGDGERRPTEAFSGLQSHYLFAAKFGRPGKGNDKGNVEGLVGYARRNFMVPVPRVASWEELNAQLLEACRKRRARKLWGHQETIAERFEREREKLLPLPATLYEACDQRTTRVS